MKHVCMLISVADINAARKFYEDLFGLERVFFQLVQKTVKVLFLKDNFRIVGFL